MSPTPCKWSSWIARISRPAIRGERAAEKSLRLTRDLIEQGQVSALQLLNAQQVYFDTHLPAVVQAKANRYTYTIALFQADNPLFFLELIRMLQADDA